WPLRSMAPLAQTLALLAMSMAILAIDVVPMDMAPNSFDDRYWGCRHKMTPALPKLKDAELQQNTLFAEAWTQAEAEWQNRGSPLPPLLSLDQTIALIAYTGSTSLYKEFNVAVREAGRSGQHYRDNFHFKSLHFLLTTALDSLRDYECQDVYVVERNIQFETKRGERVRFGQFMSTVPKEMVSEGNEKDTSLMVTTCYGMNKQHFASNPKEQGLLIPPYEIFEVTEFTPPGEKAQTWLRSVGTLSNYNCEWLRGDIMGTPGGAG
ncbi:NRT2 ribosyltransferase, partial [Malurus elegans]|nr:NRT2 ribosyltransferase [Malurus elegans]